ncbi:MAG: hypothetical protein ACRDKY_03245 [Solirubrobacteraceae bacterium]
MAVVTEVTAVFLAYMVVNVPVLGPLLTREEANQHWPEAIIAALVVAAGTLFVVRTALRRRASEPEAVSPVAPPAVSAPAQADLPRIPRSLHLERVPAGWVRLAAAWTLAAAAVSFALGAPLWLAWLTILAPWLAFVAIEGRIRYARDAVFACFGLLVVLQLLHMVEHSTQVGQLLATGGSFARSHGAIGQLDFETVHFVTDTTLWISLGLLAIIFKARNAWLWVAFAAASMHQVEHFYLFSLYVGEHTVYLSGGAAGILGDHGLIGTPLDRPYLHYTYNFIVFVPMVIAFWDEARRMDRVHPVSHDA